MDNTLKAANLAPSIQYLLSLPAAMAERFGDLEGKRAPEWFATADPPGGYLGSGGATANVLAAGWRATGQENTFAQWLSEGRKLIIHGGGQSRRLPAYAVAGKPLMPVPALRWSRGQRLDQTLLDLQLPAYRRLLGQAPATSRVMVTSGDVVLRFGARLPVFPAVDVLGLGMEVEAEQAQHFGVFFAGDRAFSNLRFFLQKPDRDRLCRLTEDHEFLVDTGVWLLSERAVALLMRRTGWNESEAVAGSWTPRGYELYADFGLALGDQPTVADEEIRALSCAVVRLPEAEFYHLGTSQQMIDAMWALQNRRLGRGEMGYVSVGHHGHEFALNARLDPSLRTGANHSLWVENSCVPACWSLASRHVLTGVPDNAWPLQLEPGVCLDFVPVGKESYAIRVYGIDDTFRGALGRPDTLWLGRPAGQWFEDRGLSLSQLQISEETDIQAAPIFPLLRPDEIDVEFLEWTFAVAPASDPSLTRRWLEGARLSADDLMRSVNLDRWYASRAFRRRDSLASMLDHRRRSVLYQLDLDAAARLWNQSPDSGATVPKEAASLEPMQEVRESMFQAALMRARGDDRAEVHEGVAFERLRELIEREARLSPAHPQCQIQEDQIVWGRSPVRLDLAGGWTDTPPYCLENGGRVVNAAVDLNGQPPLQVFARLAERPEIVIRSIDLGMEQRIDTFESLATYAQPGSEFALAKAALALAGFLPRFHPTRHYRTLRQQLEDFGGGIEISLLAAVPKGSGLGTSSILAATLLATLGDLCGLGWDRHVIFGRTLAAEQMITTGGGWQDQAGGIFRGLKMIETAPGLEQQPTLRWLPDHLFGQTYANRTVLLYYTGLTRMAVGILHEVVRGVFLNDPDRLAALDAIGRNAEIAFGALQEANFERLGEAVDHSWKLNQELDDGTNPPAVRQVIESIQDYVLGCKLLGAGGGGYLLMLAKDEEAGRRIRRVLGDQPPNRKARMVDLTLSETGLQVTRS